MSDTESMQIALAQIAPVWLDREATIDKVLGFIDQAARRSARLVCFGEALIPGYPFWVEHTEGAKFESRFQKELYAHYSEQAVQIERGDLKRVQDAARQSNIWVVIGIIERPSERGGHSVYASAVIIDDQGSIRNVHRKLMPTHEERLVWAQGDGHGLRTFDLDGWRLGVLNCWENWMPLARSALYAQGLDLHVAIWPGNVRNTENITRHIACEGRCYVASVSGVFAQADVADGLPHAKQVRAALPAVSANGGSCLSDPSGQWLIEPNQQRDQILVQEIYRTRVSEARHSFDPFGHYSRPDVLKLSVQQARQSGFEVLPDPDLTPQSD